MKKIILATALLAFASISLAAGATREKTPPPWLGKRAGADAILSHNQTVPVTNKDKKATTKHHATALLKNGRVPPGDLR